MAASLKTQPHSFEAERVVLAELLSSNVNSVLFDYLNIDDFYLATHQMIYKALKRVRKVNPKADFLDCVEYLDRKDLLVEIAILYIQELIEETKVGNPLAHADVVRERACLRELTKTSDKIAALVGLDRAKYRASID